MNREIKLCFLTSSAGLALGLVVTCSGIQPENGMIQKVNSARVDMGLGSLAFDPDLTKVAKTRSIESATSTPLTHYDQEGSLIFTQLLWKVQYPYALVGENLARCSPPAETVVDRCFEALMNSPVHRANILEPKFKRIAVGYVTNASGMGVFAQIFAQPPEEAHASSYSS